MSLWQNFKDTDHEFERRFFGYITLLSVGIFLCYLFDIALNKVPDVRVLLLQHGVHFIYFLIGIIIIILLTGAIYYRTLDFWEAETEATKNACIINAIIWSCFWICWSIFCACITPNTIPLNMLDLIFIFLLVFIPGFIAFLISKNIRTKEILQMKKEISNNINASKMELFTIFVERKYYSGYYGLICLPVYLVALLIGRKLW